MSGQARRRETGRAVEAMLPAPCLMQCGGLRNRPHPYLEVSPVISRCPYDDDHAETSRRLCQRFQAVAQEGEELGEEHKPAADEKHKVSERPGAQRDRCKLHCLD